ncbi:TonB-dependent receptor domain-containing protein [Pseudoalteromonas denitrificans]|uniref:Hemoglobin/transferrin/lactoferrin receptor protein n=1 Tax=Pseudoalteromonas denitrificans DSM 6059 TaxID=1123010 RepID=A0A1I1Q8N2_9GAMM|nr:TonB-dependent receptor [Pseudoalteromonas denitrificans]SFD18347.1 hemoglobin/transferrin/lactoferrin receptor protein [Pseudoalteromonas denitrificans DSM 6059]
MSTLSFNKSALCLLISSILTSNISYAKESEIKDDKDLEHVEIWNTEIKASSLYFNEETIASKQADHLSDLLRTIPGIDVGGSHSMNQRITIRSLEDKDLKVTIDGANQNTYMYHHMGNLQIHADILKSVDIEVGTNSVVNGGLGGAVRFETKKASELLQENEQFGARLQTTVADNSANSYSLTGFGQLNDDIDVLAYYNFVDRQNFEVGGGKLTDENGDKIPGTDGEVKGLAGELQDALIKFGWDISENQRIELGYETYHDEGDYSYRPDMGSATDIAITDSLKVPLVWPTEFSRDTLTLNYTLNWSDDSVLKVAVFSNESELYRDESGWAINPQYATWAAKVTGNADNTGINILGNTFIDGDFSHNLTYGYDLSRHDTDYNSLSLTNELTSADESATNSALFIQDKISFENGLSITPGLRYNDYDIDSTVVDNSFSELTAALAAEYVVNAQLVVKLSSTQLFKGPELGEVFTGAGLRDTANQDIEAETGLNTEFAIAYQAQVLGADSFTAGITVFNTDLENYIFDDAPVAGGGPRDLHKDNVGDMQVNGFEAYTGYILDNLQIQLSYSVSESELNAFAGYASLEDTRLDREQGDTFSANIDYAFETLALTLHWDILNVASLDHAPSLDGATIDTAKDSYTIQNISLNWTPSNIKGLGITLGIDNLFDEYYASQSSRTGLSWHPRFGDLFLTDYEPGRNIKATASYKF